MGRSQNYYSRKVWKNEETEYKNKKYMRISDVDPGFDLGIVGMQQTA